MNTLYYGDNLQIMRRYLPDESVDLVYLDPPFNSNRDYNVLFKEQKGQQSPAQIKAFTDTWRWSEEPYDAFVQDCPNARLVELMQGFVRTLGRNDVTAYLVMMAPRLVEMHRVLKPTGSLYLHCDPTVSHYLKLVLDCVFGPTNFRNEIVWKRTAAKGLQLKRLPVNHDLLLCYQKSAEAYWDLEASFTKYDPYDLSEKTASKYSHRDPDGRLYQLSDLTNPNPNRPNLTYEFLGMTKVWRWTKDRMQAAYEAGLVVQPSPGSVPRFKRYLEEQRGLPLSDVWSDINPINSQAQERLGYPTQKPQALLERIITLSSQEGDVVLDPFCGCGTAIVAAQALGRQWVGMDITHLAIALIKSRLADSFGLKEEKDYAVVGEPTTVFEAEALAQQDRDEFQKWAVGLVPGAHPYQQKKGADSGIDGVLHFRDNPHEEARKVVLQVKSGHVSVQHVRDFRGVIDREKATLGLFICLEEPTEPMRIEAGSVGFYKSPLGGKPLPILQLRTIADLLEGKAFQIPAAADILTTKAPKQQGPSGQKTLEL